MASESVERLTREIGEGLLEAIERHRPRAAERLQDWLLTDALNDERFRTRMLRFVDVFAAVEATGDAEQLHRLLREYFEDDFPGLPRSLRWLLRIARNPLTPSTAVQEAARRSIGLFARRFIAESDEASTRELLDRFAGLGRYPSFDLLGEAVLSDAEADAYQARYLRLIEAFSQHPSARETTPGGLPALQLSLKLSSLTYRFTPVDLEGSVERVTPRLERIASAAREAGVGVCVDAEQFEVRDVVWGAFERVFGADGPLSDWEGAGMVVQGYLRDADTHLDQVLAAARRRGRPFQVRLVKGAYWDYETIVAAANRWSPPVFQEKSATDHMYDVLLERLVDATGAVYPAVASHNPRTHALARALLEERGLPPGAIEHQTLHRTLEALSTAIAEAGWPAREYVPSGDLIPGMAYLVRRILENSSQAGFLTLARSGRTSADVLGPPPVVEDVAEVAPDDAAFERAPVAEWHAQAFREGFEAALRSARSAPARRSALPPGVARDGWRAVVSPSDPAGTPLAEVEYASPQGMLTAVERARNASGAWAAVPVSERSRILRTVADLLLERGHDFAAHIVREGGRDRAGAWAEVEEAVDFLRLYAQAAEGLWEGHGSVIAPRGVVAVIPPWNFSLAIPCGMVSASLVCGNPAILKPAEQTPVIAHHLAGLFHEAGIPQDALQCLPGAGETAGRALVEDARVAMVAFTGSRAVGTWMHEAVSATPALEGRPRSLIAEMGGKNPAIVLADADVDEAVEGVLISTFGHANQKCSAVSRVLVERSNYPTFRDRLAEAARSWRVGAADDSRTAINPIIDHEAVERLRAAADCARREGRVLLDRFDVQPGSLLRGPLVIEVDVAHALSTQTTTEELFGPIVALIPFDDQEDAIRVANGTGYGLTAGLYSRSPSRIERIAQSIAAGHLYVNRSTTAARPGVEPFGGMHFSGTGPKVGHAGYLWAFVHRTDAPPIEEDVTSASPAPHDRSVEPPEPWPASLDERVRVIETAAVSLGGSPAAAALHAAARVARRELAEPAPTVPAAGEVTRMVYDYPRGAGLLRAVSDSADWWLAAALLAGNGVVVLDSPALDQTVAALRVAGIPASSLRTEAGDATRFVRLAAAPGFDFAACDRGPLRSLARALGPTREGDRGMRATITTLDGPQPGEAGFLQRFAWPRVTTIRTLRHGADLHLGGGAEVATR